MVIQRVGVFIALGILLIACAPTTPSIERRQLQKDLAEMIQAAKKAPSNLQLKADLGWIYIQSGKYKEGIPLLMDAPYEPSAISEVLFPDASDSIERGQLYLKAIDAFNANFDDTKLVLGHIFVSHLSREEVIDQDLVVQLRLLADQTQSPIVYDALRGLSYTPNGQKDSEHRVQYAEAAIRRINDLSLQVKDRRHLSHFYYNAACGFSGTKDYEKAAVRLQDAFSIDGSLRSWSLRDPDLENVRKHLGSEKFRKLIGEVP
jgi:tetratricopeptide (TPR) repeat protein